jgi:O-antigen/teichoic acid export membrane protein
MFLYTDIFIIKFLSDNANIEIANYSFALNIANILLIIPLTLVQVDIEKLKNNINYVSELNKKILVLVFTTTLGLICFFIILTNLFFNDYKNIFIVFLIILSAKIIQSFSPLYGSMLIIKRKFKTNLLINLSALFINILLSYILYSTFSIQGIAIASVISLLIRQLMLYKFYLVGINVKKEF